MNRRELFPLVAGAAGMAAAADLVAKDKADSGPELKRISYQSKRTGQERDYFVYLPPGHAKKKDWPVMLFLHGDGERGDGKGELDYVLTHGPLFEAWCQKRDLPFIIISPQLPVFGRGEVPYIKYRKPDSIPTRRAEGINPRPDTAKSDVRFPEPMAGKLADDKLPSGPQGPGEGWYEIEDEVIELAPVDVFQELKQRALQHRTTPDHRLPGILEHEPERHQLHPEALERQKLLSVGGDGPAAHADHLAVLHVGAHLHRQAGERLEALCGGVGHAPDSTYAVAPSPRSSASTIRSSQRAGKRSPEM